MEESENRANEDSIVFEFTQNQLLHFRNADPRCRALQLPEGIMLRYRCNDECQGSSGVMTLTTRVFDSDSPYDRHWTGIGEVSTPMFEPKADFRHFEKLKRLLHSWIKFVAVKPDSDVDFQSFTMDDRSE